MSHRDSHMSFFHRPINEKPLKMEMPGSSSASSTDSLSPRIIMGEVSSGSSLQENILQNLNLAMGEYLIHLDSKNINEDHDIVLKDYEKVCKELDVVILPQHQAVKEGKVIEGWYLLRQNPSTVSDIAEVRVAVVGNVDAGKSTMLGVLTTGILDDGRGKARVGMFRHKHELESGRTSSIGQELLAFSSKGDVLYSPHISTHGRRGGWDEICPGAHKVISFMDLAGHEKYLKTTMFGLTGGSPDYVMLMVGANAGLIGMAKEHLALAFALSVPVLVVVTKVDMCPPNILENTVRSLTKTLKSPSARRTPMSIKSAEDVIVAAKNFVSQRLCPIFQVSNVTGEGIELLKQFLHVLPRGQRYGSGDDPVEYQIMETYVVPGVGTVVAGVLISGNVSAGQTLYLGPDALGEYIPLQIKGIQRKRINVTEVHVGQCVSFALKKVKKSVIRKGMMLLGKELVVSPNPSARSCREFEAEVVVLFHSTTIGPRYQAMLHCGVVRQTVSIVSLQSEFMRTGDRAIVRFRFIKNPEYLKVGSRLVFREGHTKGVGRITSIF